MLATPGAPPKVHQALHGYADGHRLLVSSCSLPVAAERQLLLLSDLSGPGFQPSVDAYLTGYPLREAGLYALARTWYAPEMERPGCVFTHTLLIDNTDLGALPDLRVLPGLFRRPQGPQDRAPYSQPIEIPAGPPPAQQPLSGHLAADLLLGLYSPPIAPVLLSAASAAEHEELVLRIFSQQWPRLRRSFSFCLGALAARYLGQEPFCLLAAPMGSIRPIRRELAQARFVDRTAQLDGTEPAPWLQVLLTDLETGGDNQPPGLRSFLWTFGADVLRPQEVVMPLCEVFLHLQGPSPGPQELVNLVGASFPVAQEAGHLKRTLFAPDDDGESRRAAVIAPIGWRPRSWKEDELIEALALTSVGNAFEPAALALTQRAQRLLAQDRGRALSLLARLFRARGAPSGSVMDSLAGAIGPRDVAELRRIDAALVPALMRRDPRFAAAREVWRCGTSEQRELLDALRRSGDISDAQAKGIVTALLQERSEEVAEEVLGLFGQAGADSVMSWLEMQGRPNLEPGWARALGRMPLRVLDWLDGHPGAKDATLVALLAALDPTSPEVLRYPTEIWFKRYVPLLSKADKDARIEVATFLFTIGMVHDGPGAAELLSLSFETVHEAAQYSNLPFVGWRRLERLLPPADWWRDWDRAERLRRGFASRFILNWWPVELFVRAIEEERTLRDVLDACKKIESGGYFLRQLQDGARAGQIQLSPRQRELLKRAL